MSKLKYGPILLLFLHTFFITAQPTYDTSKPWTYWWWMGSAVNKSDIQKQLIAFSDAGIGGVHIIPIYGVKGYESEFIPFLSKGWMELVSYTIDQAHKLDLGVDLTLGTGWPYGGNWINNQHAAKKLVVKEIHLNQTDRINLKLDHLQQENQFLEFLAIKASNNQGDSFDLLSELNSKGIHKLVPLSDWKITLFGITNTKQQVKRAAPGGEGFVIDYFDQSSVNKYLYQFDSVFSATPYPIQPRAFYHDSYEVYGANWTSLFSDKFQRQRGYDVNKYLPLLTDSLHPLRSFFIHDIRETISEMLYNEFTLPWTQWCSRKNAMTRNQAHGSPANILDLYALADIPETESFGCSVFDIPQLTCDPDYEEDRFGRPSPLMMKFASSPAHLMSKSLVSSETGTWLGNHFKVSLKQIKPQIDELFVAGINHIFYHGITYSPGQESYPGWLFYASTNFGPTSHFWDELPLLNTYIYDCQKLLQNATPDNKILLYFPINDLWTKFPGDLLLLLDVHKYSQWFSKTEFGQTAQLLWDHGHTFDYLSDKQLQQMQLDSNNQISFKDQHPYSCIIIPPVDYINKTTLKKICTLAQSGANILFMDKYPQHPSGILDKLSPELEFQTLTQELKSNGNVLLSESLLEDLDQIKIKQEEIKIKGLDFIRKKNQQGYLYFISNLSNRFYADSITLSVKHAFVKIIDPQSNKEGQIKTSGAFYFQLPPGKSCFIQTSNQPRIMKPWHYFSGRDTIPLNQEWQAQCQSEEVHSEIHILESLTSWTDWGDETLKNYCGKVKYTSHFSMDSLSDSEVAYRMVFEDIRETAEVYINGHLCGTIWSFPLELDLPGYVLKKENFITIIVQNLSANKIKAIDQQNQKWKRFYDINFVDIQYKPFDASHWEYTPSGLIGDILLIKNE